MNLFTRFKNWLYPVSDPVLAQFYREYYNWAVAKIPDRKFNKVLGLCNNFGVWAGAHGMNVNRQEHLRKIMRNQFEAENLDRQFPFGGRCKYLEESRASSQHLNKQRLAFVKKYGKV